MIELLLAASLAKPIAIYTPAVAADYLSTRHALSAGARESNPLMQSQGTLAGWKAAQLGALVGVDYLLQKGGHKGKARLLRVLVVVGYAGLTVHNVEVARRQRRLHAHAAP